MIEEIPTRAGAVREGSTRGATQGTGRRPKWWLIAKKENGRVEFLTTERDGGGGTLAVFGHEEEAAMFVYLGGYGDGWRARESSAGEIVSVLCGPCSGAKSVALDPLPGMEASGMPGLVRLRRERFLGWLLEHPR